MKNSKVLYALLGVTLFAIVSSFFLNTVTYAEENYKPGELTLEDYEGLIADDILDEDVSYEVAKQLYFSPEEFTEEDFIGEKLTDEEAEIQMQANAAYKPRKGDIVITTNTSASGVTGHAGIFISSTEIRHFQSKKAGLKTDTWGNWKKKYPKTKVLRTKSERFNAAGNWVIENYVWKNTNPNYKINTELAKTNPSYCSKLIWQGHFYGAGSDTIRIPASGIIPPYSLQAAFYKAPSVPYNTTNI